jgi:hypothetical protein
MSQPLIFPLILVQRDPALQEQIKQSAPPLHRSTAPPLRGMTNNF